MAKFELIADDATNDAAAFINQDGTTTSFYNFVPEDQNGDDHDPRVITNLSSDLNLLLSSGDLNGDGSDEIIMASPYGTVTAYYKDTDNLSMDDHGQSVTSDEGNNVLTGSEDDHVFRGGDTDDELIGGNGDDLIDAGSGNDIINGGSGIDTIILGGNGTFGSNLKAYNISSNIQIGTGELVNLKTKTKFSDVIDGGEDIDTVKLTDNSDAFFLHDNFSGFHSSLELVEDYDNRFGLARIKNVENISAGAGDDVIDLTSPDYSLAGQELKVDAGTGNDVIWGSDANETLIGNEGDDVLFGGAGINILTGGTGADEFQFSATSNNDHVTDFDLSQGDTLKFFNTGGADFDKSSIKVNHAANGIAIDFLRDGSVESLNISLGVDAFSLSENFLNSVEILI